MKQNSKISMLINWCFLLYMVILAGERIQSLIRSFIEGPDFAFGTFMIGLYNVISLASIAISLILLFVLNRDFLKGLFMPTEVNYKNLWTTSGVLLISGMIHTEFTILYIQFVAYAFLLLALALKTVLVQEGKNRVLLWLSLCYLMSFSMAIPVNYITSLDAAPIFHAMELLVSISTIGYFIYMCDKVFWGEGEHLFLPIPFTIVLIGDIFLIAFRWREYQNIFLLGALILTSLLFLIGKILELHYKRKERKS